MTPVRRVVYDAYLGHLNDQIRLCLLPVLSICNPNQVHVDRPLDVWCRRGKQCPTEHGAITSISMQACTACAEQGVWIQVFATIQIEVRRGLAHLLNQY
jgi:hypothetical protein